MAVLFQEWNVLFRPIYIREYQNPWHICVTLLWHAITLSSLYLEHHQPNSCQWDRTNCSSDGVIHPYATMYLNCIMRNVTLYNNAVTRRGFRCEYFIFNGWASLAHKRMPIPNDITYCGISENVSGQRL